MKRILIIDDEPDVAETMKLLIEKKGYAAEYTLDPARGLEMMKKFDLVLLDIIMPKMSGRDVLARMKRRGINTPVIVVSAVGLPGEVARELSSKYGDIGFVPKTDMRGALMDMIAERMGSR